MRFLGSFFGAIWRGLDGLRRALHLLLMLLLAALVIAALRQSVPHVPAKAALVVKPGGDLVEQLSGESLQQVLTETQAGSASQTLLWNLTTAIRAAASDPRIQALYIDTDDMGAAGQAKLEELAAAIAEFRRSGKKVIARGDSFQQAQYYLAAQADEIYLDPFGYVLLDGYDRYRTYLKDALDKLGVDVHLFRAGKFKSAAEPYIRASMSDEDRLESQTYLSALWGGYRNAVAQARGLKPQAIAQYADGYTAAVVGAGGDTAQVAKAAGLVTGLATQQQVDERLSALVGADGESHSFNRISVQDYLRAVRTRERTRGTAQVGVVMATGDILDGKQPPGSIGGESTSDELRQALYDKNIRAVVLRVDSPGGSVMASEQIYRAVLALKQAGKVVVVSMGDLAASGGYYIAAAADRIFASPNTITGSIGVFAAVPTIDRTLAKVGVHVDGVGTTPLSGALDLRLPMSADAGKLLQATVDHDYGEFLARVAAGRGRSRDAINDIAQGRVWAGSDALRLGLVDQLGTYEDALKYAATRAGLKDYRVRIIGPRLNWMQQLVLQLRSTAVRALARVGLDLGLDAVVAPGTVRVLRQLQPVEREIQRWQRLSSGPDRALAYCFCAVD